MTTPKQPVPTTGRVLEPSKLAVKKFTEKRVYPDGSPDDFGQVNHGDKDRSRIGSPPEPSTQDHYHSDVDSSQQAQHHSLGTSRNQASPGNHIHDGVTSPKLGPLQMAPGGNATVPALVLTGSKGGNVALTNLINMLKNFVNFTDNTT